jgi:hypothetical protein
MVQMLGWFSALAARASRRKRSEPEDRGQVIGEFESDEAAEFRVFRLIDDAHPAAAEFLEMLVTPFGIIVE